MSERATLLEWSERGLISDPRAALDAAGVLPNARDWRGFLDRLLLWSGAVALGAALVFFIAYNWDDLGRFAKFALVEALVAVAVIGYWKLGVERAGGKASLLLASIFVGALLALFGQTYQTGADTWELFATWAAMIAPWVLVSRFAVLWMAWLAISNVAISLYFNTHPRLLHFIFATEQLLWTLFVLDTIALVAWALAARRVAWLNERWAPRLLIVATGATITALVLHAILDWRDATRVAVLIYPAWLAAIYVAYRRLDRDLLALAAACLSVIVVTTTFLTRHLVVDGRAESAPFLFIALVVIAMAASAGAWLKAVAREVSS
jgi:uncharacterized membrane protein